jgi:uncharacterized Tic20 family protein
MPLGVPQGDPDRVEQTPFRRFTVSDVTTAAAVMPTNAAATLTQPTPGSLPATYVEGDPNQCNEAKIAHLLGIFGILGTGIFYLVKKGTAGPFVRDQMAEAFNFHLLVLCSAIALNIVGVIAAMVAGPLAVLFSLAVFAIWIGALVLSITNAMKAGKGQVCRYPARLSVLK